MWTATVETTLPCFPWLSTRLERGTPKPAISNCRVLIKQVCILCPATFPEVTDLHDFRKKCDIDCGRSSFFIIVLFENFVVLREGMLAVVGTVWEQTQTT
jgi:hypothetical protein